MEPEMRMKDEGGRLELKKRTRPESEIVLNWLLDQWVKLEMRKGLRRSRSREESIYRGRGRGADSR